MPQLESGLYCMYLRKSREDLEAESHGEGDTLLRHEHTLMALAKKLNISIGRIYREIVSGESIDSRPQVQELIRDVEQRKWKGVLVVEVERLARGDTLDQGIIARAFSISGTKIITPLKIYDPLNDSDMEYFEFGLFMSRREYATINRRIQNGRRQSVMEGKWIFGDTPYGYTRVKIPNDKGYTLEINPDEAPAVEKIFQWYAYEHMGSYVISIKLTELGYRNRHGQPFSSSSIRDILKNKVYTGYVKFGERKEVKQVVDGKVKKVRKTDSEYVCVKGLHPAIIDEETFRIAQQVRAGRSVCANSFQNGLQNPFAGILICKECGHVMQRMPDKKRGFRLICKTVNCPTISSHFQNIEDAVLSGLDDWTRKFSLYLNNETEKKDTYLEDISRLQKEKDALEGQKEKLYDLLERDIYDEKTFLRRNQDLAQRINQVEQSISKLTAKHDEFLNQVTVEEFLKRIQYVKEAYWHCDTVEQQNALLKSIFRKIEYEKKQGGRGKESAFSLEFYPVVDFLA